MIPADYQAFCRVIACCPACRALDPLRFWRIERQEYQASINSIFPHCISPQEIEDGEENTSQRETDVLGCIRFFCRTCQWTGRKTILDAWLNSDGILNEQHVEPIDITERPLPLGSIVRTLQGEVGLADGQGSFIETVAPGAFGYIAKAETTALGRDGAGGEVLQGRYTLLFPQGLCNGRMDRQPLAPVTFHDLENRDFYQVYGGRAPRVDDLSVAVQITTGRSVQKTKPLPPGRVVILGGLSSNPDSKEEP